jgi:ribosomal subunit interface protein
MQVPLELSTRRITLSPALEADLRKRATKLERHFDRITSCRIAVERPSNHHNEGGPYRVRLDITVPGSELVANKEAEDLNTAIREAFDAAERQVEEFSRRRRGEVKTLVGKANDLVSAALEE